MNIKYYLFKIFVFIDGKTMIFEKIGYSFADAFKDIEREYCYLGSCATYHYSYKEI